MNNSRRVISNRNNKNEQETDIDVSADEGVRIKWMSIALPNTLVEKRITEVEVQKVTVYLLTMFLLFGSLNFRVVVPESAME